MAGQQDRAGDAGQPDAEALDRSGFGDLRIDTDGLSAREVADLVSQCWQTLLSGTRSHTS